MAYPFKLCSSEDRKLAKEFASLGIHIWDAQKELYHREKKVLFVSSLGKFSKNGYQPKENTIEEKPVHRGCQDRGQPASRHSKEAS